MIRWEAIVSPGYMPVILNFLEIHKADVAGLRENKPDVEDLEGAISALYLTPFPMSPHQELEDTPFPPQLY